MQPEPPDPQLTLAQAADAVLIEHMPAGLRDAIDDALAKGANPAVILAVARRGAKRAAAADPTRGPLTVAAVEAYLTRKLEEPRPCRQK